MLMLTINKVISEEAKSLNMSKVLIFILYLLKKKKQPKNYAYAPFISSNGMY